MLPGRPDIILPHYQVMVSKLPDIDDADKDGLDFHHNVHLQVVAKVRRMPHSILPDQ